MAIFLSAIQGVLTIVFVLAVGYYLAFKKLFDERIADLFAKVVLNVSLPLNMIVNITSFFNKEELISSTRGIFVSFVSMLLSYSIALILATLFKIKKGRKGVFIAIFSLSNTIFIGLPMSQALLGEIATPYTLLYYIANTVIWWTIGVYGIVLDTQDKINGKTQFNLQTIKKVFNPPFIGFLFGVFLVFINVQLPKFVFEGFRLVGNLTTPLSLFYVSIIIYQMGSAKLRLDRDALLVFLGRFVITPAIVIILNFFVPLPKLMRNVFIIMSAMPVMINSAVIARLYGGDHEFAVSMISWSTILSVIVMPFLMLLIRAI